MKVIPATPCAQEIRYEVCITLLTLGFTEFIKINIRGKTGHIFSTAIVT